MICLANVHQMGKSVTSSVPISVSSIRMHALHEAFNVLKPQDRCVRKLQLGLDRAPMLQPYAKNMT